MGKKIASYGLDFMIRISEFFLVLIIIIDCNSIYRHAVDVTADLKKWCMVASSVMAFLLILFYVLKDRENFRCILEYKALFVISLLFCLEFNAFNSLEIIQADMGNQIQNYGEYFIGFFLIFMNLCVVLFRIYRKNGESFRLLFLIEKVIVFLTVVSLILWVGTCLLELWGKDSDVFVFWGGEHYYSNHLNLFVRRWWYVGDLKKNLSIFVEPPMFGLFLGFSLYTELFLKKKSNLGIVAILVLGLISCRAILAIVISLGAALFVLTEMLWKKKGAKLLIPVIWIAAFAGAVGLIIYKSIVGWGSFSVHVDDFVACFKCWKEYPIFGCGYDYLNPIFYYASDFRMDNLGMSNSAGVVLAEGGILLFIYYVIPFVLMMTGFFKGNRKLAYWSAGMFLFWVVVIFHARTFVFVLMALGYSMVDVETHLLNKKEGQKRIKCSLWIFKENQGEEGEGWFSKKILDLPDGMIVMMGAFLVFTALYGLLCGTWFSLRNVIVAILVLLAEVVVLVLNLKKKFSKREMTLFQIEFWMAYVLFGQPYRVLNDFMTRTNLRTQDVWWQFIAFVLVLYGVGMLVDDVKRNRF